MAEADRAAIASGPFDGIALMRNAGAAVVKLVLERFAGSRGVDVLCGPGNNGGDGYVAASLLKGSGVDVRLWRSEQPKAGSDAARAARECDIKPRQLADFQADRHSVIIDALFGAGLAKPLQGDYAGAVEKAEAADAQVVAVDLPSGISGESGRALGPSISADVTVTFFRKKPGHLLFPGKAQCGEVIVADIGIDPSVIESAQPSCFENVPALWISGLPSPDLASHKYSRGHVGVFSGGPASTGAARLAAMAAARAGAGAVTLLSQSSSLQVNAAHLTSIILRKTDSFEAVEEFLHHRKPDALVFGPGLGTSAKVGEVARQLLAAGNAIVRGIVFDADAITVFARDTTALFEAARVDGAPAIVLTPHEGEFGRLFPDIAADDALSKLDKARNAAKRAGATIVYKGPDTVIAAPDGQAAINGNGTPFLATAGSGDVLSGIVAAFLAQGMRPFEAACAAVWMHAEAARSFGPGLIAEDLPVALVSVLREFSRT
jgi:ADP-dependent NAD(P)H-hydrate dehydratase / NAD(P)H-hydrate epimerase